MKLPGCIGSLVPLRLLSRSSGRRRGKYFQNSASAVETRPRRCLFKCLSWRQVRPYLPVMYVALVFPVTGCDMTIWLRGIYWSC